MIDMANVFKTYDRGNLALKDITLHVDNGEFVYLTGQSGAGKSTLIKLLFREVLPDSGQIFIAGRSIIRLNNRETVKLRRNTGVVFQDFRLMENKTVFENVAFALKVLEYPWNEVKEIVPKVLERLKIADKADAFPRQLSGGEQQRVAFARAVINNPPIILADEPTGNLDSKSTQEIMNVLKDLHRSGRTVILITHDDEIAAQVKRVVRIKDGRIEADFMNDNKGETDHHEDQMEEK